MNLFDFLQKRLYQEISENKSMPREKETTQNIPRHIYYQTFSQARKIHQQIPKRSLHKQKRSLKRNLYQINFNRNLYHKTLKTQFLYQNHRAKNLYQIVPKKKPLPNKISLEEVSFEIVLVEILPLQILLVTIFSSENFWYRCIFRNFLVDNV